MKKLLALIMTAVMCLSLMACGSVPKEKLSAVDADLEKIQSLYQETEKILEKANGTGYDDVQDIYKQNKPILGGIKTDIDEMKKTFSENRDKYDEGAVDKILEENKKMIAALEEMKSETEKAISQIESAIKETEKEIKKETEELLKQSALANVEIYEVPDLDGTTWTLAGGMEEGTEMEDADLKAVLETVGGQSEYVFSAGNKIQLLTGTGSINGSYISNGELIEISFDNGVVYNAAFTVIENDIVMIVIADGNLNTGLYYVQK